jgi:carbon storage regulator
VTCQSCGKEWEAIGPDVGANWRTWRKTLLVLSRKPGETVVIGDGITLTVIDIKGNRVRVGIEAPDQVRILRAELAGWQDEPAGNDEAAESALLCR